VTDGEVKYGERSDSVETKLKLLLAARESGDYRQALAVADSLKDGLEAEWRLGQHTAPGSPVLPSGGWRPASELPAPWSRWADGWTLFQTVAVVEESGLARVGEPVDILVAAHAGQVHSLAREVRVGYVDAGTGELREVPSQVYDERRLRLPATSTANQAGGQDAGGEPTETGERQARLVWLADVPAGGRGWYVVLAGNPAAELPEYVTDLRVHGEGFGLDVENAHFFASLSRQMGQLERLTYKRAHGLELFAGGEGHGEPPNIDWAHDYLAAGKFQKFRLTNWETCRNYEVTRGPLCVVVRRWGFPHSPLHPVFTASRMLVDVTYTFYAGAPYFLKDGRMETVKDFSLNYLRDDEWVFSGYCFTDMLWMDENGRVHEGSVPREQAGQMWGVGFYHGESQDAFFSLRLDHRLEGPSASGASPGSAPERRPVLHHADGPTLSYVPHGHVWSRWALRGDPQLQAGDTLIQRNAYLVEPYTKDAGAARIEAWRERLLSPLRVQRLDDAVPAEMGHNAQASGVLARPGEGTHARELKRAIWTALREVRDEMFYTADANVVDMGYIYDVRLRGSTVQVIITMSHRGRPKYMFLGQHVRARLERLDGVRSVVVDLTWDPPWTPDRLSEAGWQAMGLETGR
jgi:metal-sulfur cluster biosynthetic enzyme